MNRFIASMFLMILIVPVSRAEINVADVVESYTETVKVSGKYHLGFQYDSPPDLKSLHVYIPENSKGDLCLFLSSIDGKYKAELSYKLTGNEVGLTKVNFKSLHEEKVKYSDSRQLAVVASIEKSCSEFNGSNLIIASWTDDIKGASPILLIRSEARIDEVNIPTVSDSQYKFKCKKIAFEKTVTFDKYCQLDSDLLKTFGTLEVRRKHFRAMDNEVLSVSL